MTAWLPGRYPARVGHVEVAHLTYVLPDGRPAMRAHRSHELVGIDDCLIAAEGARPVDATAGPPVDEDAQLPSRDAATHDVELTPRPETIVTIDVAHRGLGTASCGPDTLDRYKIGPGTYRWSWSITPFEG